MHHTPFPFLVETKKGIFKINISLSCLVTKVDVETKEVSRNSLRLNKNIFLKKSFVCVASNSD